MRKILRNAALGAAALALLAGGMAPVGTATADEKVKVYVSLGFEGNTWMDAATNLLSSIAGTKDYKDRVDIQIQSARGNAQTQIQQINAMVQAGAQVIVSWALSPTALNRAIRNACGRGVVFVTFDAQVTEPCAYHVGINQDWAGAGPAEWLAEELGGKGNIVFMGGIPGNMVDLRRNSAAKAVFAEFPDITIIADTPSMWNNATAKQKLTEIVATHGWTRSTGCGRRPAATSSPRCRWTKAAAISSSPVQAMAPTATGWPSSRRNDRGRLRAAQRLHGLAALGRAVCLQARDDEVRRHRHSALLRDPDAPGNAGADGDLRHGG